MTATEFELDELELDALTELVNIGVSRAAVSLREMVSEQVFLSVPSVAVVSRKQAAELIAELKSGHLIAVRQAFDGEFSGRALLIFPESNSLELVRAVAGEHLTLEDILELEHEALAEIGNIILNGCIATIANLLQRSLRMSLPEIVRGAGPEFFELVTPSVNDVVLFIHINFSLKGREVSGYIALVMDLPSLAIVKTLIDAFIERTAR
ncbi:chemotaxis protein CheX [Roseiterribacter gracilis]|uniref:Chemotaxis protein CheC n=1 Tax=Roseiterribacter gracilis TaxID=2812848 RepID=A0A8S8XI39_9PROT|nr:chemotaxis protein CheC [Rhodospirillales bacterium TMPK1]